MSDQKKWFKVWTAILSDWRFDPITENNLTDLGRFAWLGAYAALHGDSGYFSLPTAYLLAKLHVTDLLQLNSVTALSNISFEESKTHDGETTVTIKKWSKYQEDSTVAERMRALRNKRRGEEKRRDKKRGYPWLD